MFSLPSSAQEFSASPTPSKKKGWVLGSLMLFTVAFLTYHCMMLLIYTRRRLESLLGFSKINSFGDLGFAVYGPDGRFIVNTMIVMSLSGFYIGYLVFIANTLAFIFNLSTDNISPKIWGFSAKSIYIWGCFPFQLGLNAIPTLTHLAPLSIFADVDLGAMGIVNRNGGRCNDFLATKASFASIWGILCVFLWFRCGSLCI